MARITQAEIKKHTKLLNLLSSLDYVPTAQEDNNARLSEVIGEVEVRQRTLEGLRAKTKSERNDVDKFDSPLWRMYHRIRVGGKEALTQLREKERSELVEAWKKEREAEDELQLLLQEKLEREKTRDELAEKSQQRVKCQSEIDALYQGLFDGPTPEYPEEEAVEERLKVTQRDYNLCQVRLNDVTKAIVELIKAEKGTRKLMAKLRDAQNNMAQYPFGTDTWQDTMSRLNITTAALDLSICTSCVMKAEKIIGFGLVSTIAFPKIAEPKYEQDIIDNRWVLVLVPGFEQSLAENIGAFQECHTRLSGEIDRCHVRIQNCQSELKHHAQTMISLRKELAEVRCGIIIRVTDPAAIQPITHRSAPNAIEHGDTELPTYIDPEATSSIASNLNRAASRSVAVPTYEQAQEQAKPSGGFRVTLEGGRDQVPTHAPPGVGPAPGPGGIGGFRGTTGSDVAARPLTLRIPEPMVNGSPANQPTSSLLAPASPLTPGGSPVSPTPSTPRPTSWSVNPYAAAIIRRASQNDDSPVATGASSNNPFIQFMSEEPEDVKVQRQS